ncbi:TPA: NAD(P)/FAD-dependent oxidoreductase, partial [Candidatus Acetothermia bacterium]|nr:NAD(P)/FAD-dependent oxidoreductase [Candidatus Acetothermia bacterium]
MVFVIVGGGAAGFTAARTLRAVAPSAQVTILEAEPTSYYLRPGLIEVLAGRKTLPEITPFPKAWYERHGIHYRSGSAVVALDPDRRQVTLASGEGLQYDRVLLACGAEAVRPEIPGDDKPGVFTLRSAADVERIRTQAQEAKRAAVILGGWLGIEAARALHDCGLPITLLERGPWLLHRQLDEGGARALTAILTSQGIEVHVRVECAEILGKTGVTSLRLTTDEVVRAELVVISAGAWPRVQLAHTAGLNVNQGVVVNDHLATSAPHIYAAGDMAEWQGCVYGIFPAAREQGEVAARNMVEPGSVRYAGTTPSSKLKVAGVDLLCWGDTQPQGGPRRELRPAAPGKGRYVKFVLG